MLVFQGFTRRNHWKGFNFRHSPKVHGVILSQRPILMRKSCLKKKRFVIKKTY